MKEKNKTAQELGRLLGRLGKGKPKNFSEEELKKRSDRMKAYNEKRRESKKRHFFLHPQDNGENQW